MEKRTERIVTIEEAISHIHDGMTLGLSGATLFNQPVALARALIKKRVKDLTLVMLCGGIASDMLIGAGAVRKVVATYMGMQDYAPICPNFRNKAEKGEIQYWECDFQHLHSSLKGAQWGMPYLLTKAGVGTDIPKINPDLKEVEVNGQKWVQVPPTPIDASLLYCNKVDPYGNGIYNGSVFLERILATATKGPIIVQAEELVPNEEIRRDPRVVVLTGHIRANYVVEIPYGAHPDEGQGYYMHDEIHIKEYVKACENTIRGKDPSAFQKYLDRYVFSPKDHIEYLEAIGGIRRLIALKQTMI